VSVVAALSGGTIAALVVLVVLNVFAIFFGLSFLRANRAARAAAAGGEPPAKPVKAVSRRDFFRGTLVGSLLVFGAEFGAGTLVFLWPNLRGGFGATIPAGSIEDIRREIQDSGQPVYVGTGRFYVVPYEGQPSDDTDYVTAGVASEGLMALYRSACTSAAACPSAAARSGSSARATARSTTRPASTSSGRPRAGWTASRSR